MQQIADWLQKLDLSEYAERFAENKIDISVLPHITDQDLKDIGIPLGHRRKILAAINRGTASIQPVAEAIRGVEQKTQDAPERRFVTVLFSDLVGSTALSERMDAEDLREVISAYQKCVTETARRFDGFVAKYMGDGVLVYFGYPEAHEDDPERAVRSGLELVAAVGARRYRDRLGGGRRPDRNGCGAGASDSRQDAKPSSAPAKHCAAKHSSRCRRDPKASWQSV
jgi:SAM domain (Sterile alpha motif)/Adenylate and Guanylate cyclase catalytic domain